MISVVIPLYNKKDSLIRAINSAILQSECSEIIVVDDGSTDGSADVVDDLGNPKIKIIHQQNNGVAIARNTGIIAATHNWIAFLDADDEWASGYLMQIVILIKKYPHCVAVATSYFLGDEEKKMKSEIVLNGIKFKGKEGILNNYFEVAESSSPPICASAVCVRKEVLLKLGGFPVGIKSGEDLLTWAKLSLMGDIAYCKNPLATFWQESAHIYESEPSRIPEASDPVGNELLKLYKNYHGNQKKGLRKYIAHWHKMRASVYLRLGTNGKAMKEIVKSLYFNPFKLKIYIYIIALLIPANSRNYFFKSFSSEKNN